jgi:predicted transglutaminase-like cysteine proteinase
MMPKLVRRWTMVGLIAALPAFQAKAAWEPVQAAPEPAVMMETDGLRHLASGAPVLAPFGHVKFCMARPEECESSTTEARVTLDHIAIADMARVNLAANTRIRPMSKHAMAAEGGRWEVNPSRGDCNDFAVSKRNALRQLGWPASALLLAVVRTEAGEGHLVLVVRSDVGDMVLDNLTGRVQFWYETPYQWLMIQSASNPQLWNTIEARPQQVAAARVTPNWMVLPAQHGLRGTL